MNWPVRIRASRSRCLALSPVSNAACWVDVVVVAVTGGTIRWTASRWAVARASLTEASALMR